MNDYCLLEQQTWKWPWPTDLSSNGVPLPIFVNQYTKFRVYWMKCSPFIGCTSCARSPYQPTDRYVQSNQPLLLWRGHIYVYSFHFTLCANIYTPVAFTFDEAWENHRCQPSRILRGYPAFSTKFCKNPVINDCLGGVTNYPEFPQSAPSGNVVSHISWFSRRPFAFSINKLRHYKALSGTRNRL